MILYALIFALLAMLAWQAVRLAKNAGAPALLEDAKRREAEALAEAARLRGELERAHLAEQASKTQAEETLKRLEHQQKAVDELKLAFQASASEAMGKSTNEFLRLAEETLKGIRGQMEGDLTLKTTAVEALVGPLTTQIDQLRRASEELGRSQKGGEESVKELMRALSDGQEKLRLETGSLASALANNQARGQWGEMVLERLLEWAGMREGVHYETQVVAGADNQVKPDLILHLPGDRDVVIDSKAVLDSYLQATQESDPARRLELLKAHARHLRETVDSLSRKGYLEQFANAPDFVVLFLPADVFLQSAVEQDPELFERAFKKKIILATPSSFLAMLKIVERSWQDSGMAENAREISRQGQQVMDRLVKFTEHIARMGKDLENSVKSYNQMYGSLKTMVFPAVKRLRDMDVKPSKELDEKSTPKLIEETPRYKEAEAELTLLD